MSFRWTEGTTLKFVSQYLQQECLWNIKSPLYRNKQCKQSAYLFIENEMKICGFGEKEIKMKIKNLRSTYSQELKKIKDSNSSGAGMDTVYVPSVKWFSLMDASLRNINAISMESESNLHCENNTDTATGTEVNRSADDSFREPQAKLTPPTKRKRMSLLSSMVSQMKEVTNQANNTVEENEFEVFGKHVSVQLKSLPLLVALEAQEHIQLYINQIRRQHLQSTAERLFTRDAPLATYDSQDSPYSSSFCNESSYFLEHSSHDNQPSILPIHESDNDVSNQSSDNSCKANVENTN